MLSGRGWLAPGFEHVPYSSQLLGHISFHTRSKVVQKKNLSLIRPTAMLETCRSLSQICTTKKNDIANAPRAFLSSYHMPNPSDFQPQRCPYQKSSHAKSHVSVIGRNSRVTRSISMLSRKIYLLLCSPIVHPSHAPPVPCP